MAPKRITQRRGPVSPRSCTESLTSSSSSSDHDNQTALRQSKRKCCEADDSTCEPKVPHRQFTSEWKSQVETFVENLQSQRDADSVYGEFGSSEWKSALLTYLNDIKGNNLTLHEISYWMSMHPEAFQPKEKNVIPPTSVAGGTSRTLVQSRGMGNTEINQESNSDSDIENNSSPIKRIRRREENETQQNIPLYVNTKAEEGQAPVETPPAQQEQVPQSLETITQDLRTTSLQPQSSSQEADSNQKPVSSIKKRGIRSPRQPSYITVCFDRLIKICR